MTRNRMTRRCLSFVLLCAVSVSAAIAQEIAPSAEQIRPILIGSEVPAVTVQTVDGAAIDLREAIGDKPTVLVFYRGGWCPFCSQQLAELRHAEEPLRDLGVQMIALSGDAPERLQTTLAGEKVGYTLLSDYELHAAKAFGLAFQVSDEYVAKLANYKLDTKGNSVSSVQALPVPAVFVVQPDGVISFSYVNPNYRTRCDPDVLLAAARSIVQKP